MFTISEQPWSLLVMAAVAFFTIIILETIFPEKRRRWLMIIPALLAALAFGLDYFIQTDREKINTAISIATKAVEEKNHDSVETVIADNYEDTCHSSKNELMSNCRKTCSSRFIKEYIVKITSTDIQPQKANLIFTVKVLFDTQGRVQKAFEPQLMTEWQAEMQNQPDGRRLINRLELLKVGFKQASFFDFLPMM